MGQISDGLGDLLELQRADLIEQQRQNDREGELQNALDKADVQRVLDQTPAIVALEEHLEVLPADPRASPDTLAEGVILKSQHVARDGNVADQDVVHDCGQQHQVQRPAAQDALPQRRVIKSDAQIAGFLLHNHYPILSLRLFFL